MTNDPWPESDAMWDKIREAVSRLELGPRDSDSDSTYEPGGLSVTKYGALIPMTTPCDADCSPHVVWHVPWHRRLKSRLRTTTAPFRRFLASKIYDFPTWDPSDDDWDGC